MLGHHFYAMGQAAATAAHIVILQGLAVQDVPYQRLKHRLSG